MPPAPTTVQTDAVVWLEPRQARFAVELARVAGLRCVSFGFPRSAARSDAASDAAAVLAQGATGAAASAEAPLADLRHAAATTDARVLLVLTPVAEEGEKPGAVSPLDDATLLSTCKSRGIDVVSPEPLPGALTDLSWQSETIGGGPLLRQFGMFRRSSVFVQLREALANIGHVRSVFLEFTTGTGAGSLASRLVDACAVIEGLPGVGIVEAVDASVTAPEHAGAVHLALPEKARPLRGDMALHLRLGGGATASMVLSDHAGPWRRRVRIVGENGLIEASDAGVLVLDAEGRGVEAPRAEIAGGRLEACPTAAEVLGGLLRLELERRGVNEPVNWAAVLGIAEAALLSARTGQNESPETLLRMAGVG